MKYLPAAAFLSIALLLAPGVMACKDIIATNDATAGNYNLLLKVRDPSRPGLQVLCMVNESYEYDYHTPWTGEDMHFVTRHKFIGVATKDDVPPNIIKMGMAFSDAGIAYGDADVPSYRINPTRNAWDDFDWIRYACQNSSSEDDAVDRLIEVVGMHAPSVAENLFVVGPEKAYIVEANAVNYAVRQVNGMEVMSNYPKALWGKYFLKRAFIASSFDRTFEGEVRRGRVIRLGAMLGVKVVDVRSDGVVVRQFPFGERVEINKGEGRPVGFFNVDVLGCTGRKANLRVSYGYFAWENEMMHRLQSKYGSLTPEDMMNLSRLRSSELGGMRGMCEGSEEAAMIFKIPRDNTSMSMGWFAPDQCSGIFVPVHIADTGILPAYENGEAAEAAENLLEKFGRGNITDECRKVERVFIRENERAEALAGGGPGGVAGTGTNGGGTGRILTISDRGMQQQAFLMQKIFLGADNVSRVAGVWDDSYMNTLQNIREVVGGGGAGMGDGIDEKLAYVALSIAGARAEMAAAAGKGGGAMAKCDRGEQLIRDGRYDEAVGYLVKAYEQADAELFGSPPPGVTTAEKRNDYVAVLLGVAFAGLLMFIFVKRRNGS